MADYTRVERTETTVRYELETPTNAVELDKAIGAAVRDYRELYHFGDGDTPADDALTVTVEDERIVVSFRKAEKS